MAVSSKSKFAEYCLRALGSDLIEINVSVDQVNDRIDDAIQMFQLCHFESVEKTFFPYVITAEDITNEYLTILPPIMSVVSVLNFSTYGEQFGTDLWHMKADMYGSLGFGSGSAGSGILSDYVQKMTKLSEYNDILSGAPRSRFYQYTGHLHIDDDISALTVGDILLLEVYSVIDPVKYNKIWDDVWLKEYGIALIGRQWGANLQKFQQVELPGGITLNGDAIYDQYNTKVTELKDELETKYTYPPEFIVA